MLGVLVRQSWHCGLARLKAVMGFFSVVVLGVYVRLLLSTQWWADFASPHRETGSASQNNTFLSITPSTTYTLYLGTFSLAAQSSHSSQAS